MTNPITADELDEMEAQANAATPGPWEDCFIGGPIYQNESQIRNSDHSAFADVIDDKSNTNNAEFIASSRENVPRLIAEVRRLQAICSEVEKLIDAYNNGADEHELTNRCYDLRAVYESVTND